MPNWLIHAVVMIPVAWMLWKMELSAADKEDRVIDATAELKRVCLLLYSSLLIDVDHLLSWPEVYVPDRCSINTHPLHSWYMAPLYFGGSLWAPAQPFFIGVFVHLLLDLFDCVI